MKRLCQSLLVLLLCITTSRGQSQVTTFNYENIPGWGGPISCLFNAPPGYYTIHNYTHYGVAGGVSYTGTAFSLPVNASGGGTAFGIYFGFNQNLKYKIEVRARASSPSIMLRWATNPNRTASPTSCSPGFASSIISGADQTAEFNNVPSTFTDYTLINNYVPSTSGINYFLIGAYNTAASIGTLDIQQITITVIPPCDPPTLVSATALGNNQVRLDFTPPTTGTAPVDYTAVFLGNRIIPSFPFPIIVPVLQGFPITTGSPAVVTLAYAVTYSVVLRTNCGGGNNSSASNGLSVTVY